MVVACPLEGLADVSYPSEEPHHSYQHQMQRCTNIVTSKHQFLSILSFQWIGVEANARDPAKESNWLPGAKSFKKSIRMLAIYQTR